MNKKKFFKSLGILKKKTFFSIKKVLTLLFITSFIILFSALGITFYSSIQDKNHELEDLHKLNNGLIDEVSNMRTFLFDSCQESNILRDYLFLPKNNCSKYFPDLVADDLKEQSLEHEFISAFDLFFPNRNEALIEAIFLESPEEKSSKANPEEFTELANNIELKKYLEDFGYTLKAFGQKGLHLIKNKEIVADIYWDDKEQVAKINLLQEEKIISLLRLTGRIKEEEERLSQDGNEEILSALQEAKDDGITRENILVLGNNGGNVDTIILVSINHIRKKVVLISLPRDLWVDAIKINGWYSRFGINAFIKKIEKILGQKIQKYILIDMFSFPKVIDRIGGIEYTFDRPLIDPSYRTVDNEKEGTLFFPKGKQHLNGIQALRVVRSRKTTSDFYRAQRQQGILKAVRDKLKKRGKVNSIVAITPLLFRYVETNLDPKKTALLFWKVKDYSFQMGNVISTANILESEMYDLGDGRRTYILRPKGDDWTLIPQFVWNVIR